MTRKYPTSRNAFTESTMIIFWRQEGQIQTLDPNLLTDSKTNIIYSLGHNFAIRTRFTLILWDLETRLREVPQRLVVPAAAAAPSSRLIKSCDVAFLEMMSASVKLHVPF